jgi:hypothetical protein
MPFQPIDSTWQMRVVGHSAFGGAIENVFGFLLADDTTLTQAITDAFSAALATAYLHLVGAMHNGSGYDRVVITDLRTEGAPEFTSVAGGFPIHGTDSGGPLPWQTAAVVTWRTALRGKSFRGRTYLGGFTESFSDGRDVSSTLISAIEDWRDDMLSGIDGSIGSLAVTSRQHNKEPRLIGISTAITSGEVNPFWGTQRRRAGRDKP